MVRVGLKKKVSPIEKTRHYNYLWALSQKKIVKTPYLRRGMIFSFGNVRKSSLCFHNYWSVQINASVTDHWRLNVPITSPWASMKDNCILFLGEGFIIFLGEAFYHFSWGRVLSFFLGKGFIIFLGEGFYHFSWGSFIIFWFYHFSWGRVLSFFLGKGFIIFLGEGFYHFSWGRVLSFFLGKGFIIFLGE